MYNRNEWTKLDRFLFDFAMLVVSAIVIYAIVMLSAGL